MQESLLIVEDDLKLAKNLTHFLETEGYLVRCANGQTEAVRLCQGTKFDLALVDLTLRDGDGFRFYEALQSISATPVIFLTATVDESSVVTGFEMGAADYIGKPFRPRELLARIRNVLRRNHTKEEKHLITYRELTIDKNRAYVTKCGKELYLSALEYRLLLVFLSNQDFVFTRDRLADELWAVSGEFISDNTINVYIKRLREKIEDDPANPKIIQTVRGMGYQVSSETVS